MESPRKDSPRRHRGRRRALWAGLIVGGFLPAVGCQVEYAGMTLPSGKYMYDDVQYFPPGPDFPWANTQAATQRARMRAMGYDTGFEPAGTAPGQSNVPAMTPPPAPGALDPTQNVPNRPTDVNVQPMPNPVPPGAPAGPPPAAAPPGAPGGGVPPAAAPGAPGGEAPPAANPAGGDAPAVPPAGDMPQ